MPSEKLISTTQRLGRDGLADLLVQMADRIRTGELVLNPDEEALVLRLPSSMNVDVEVSREEKSSGVKTELEIEIEWYEGPEQTDQVLTLG